MTRLRLETFVPVFVLVLMLAAVNDAAAQDASRATPSVNQPSSTKVVAVPIPIAPGDLLEISVFDVPELAQQVRVGADGRTQLALIGNVTLAGLTGQQAAEMIAGELRNRNLLVQPQVNVLIKESTTQGVSVLGEVQHPGIYQVAGSRTLLDVISMAGGLTNVADTRVSIKHRSVAEESATVSLKNDDAKTSLAADLQVFPGDLIVVPRAGIVYVLGDVARPGGFVMQDSGKITLLQALAQAGSLHSTAAANRAVLLRRIDDQYVPSKIHVDRITRGEERDFELHANDILFIPNSRLKNAVQNTGSIASIAASVGTYAIIH